jgi:uncharacterized membrane protein
MSGFGTRKAGVLAMVAGGVATAAAYAQPRISTVGFNATDISADGSTVVGTSQTALSYMRWVRSGSPTTLGSDGLVQGQLDWRLKTSGDGSVLYGQAANASGLNGLPLQGEVVARWTTGTGWIAPLPLVPNASQCTGGTHSTITYLGGMSADGRFAVGNSWVNGCLSHAWFYDLNTNVTRDLGNFDGVFNENSGAKCISADGNLIGGVDQNRVGPLTGFDRPAIWTWNGAAYVEQLMPTPADPVNNQGNVACMTRSASILAGHAVAARPFFNLVTWTSVGGVWTLHDLGAIPALPSWVPSNYSIDDADATAISDDGAFIYGVMHYHYFNSHVQGAFIWTQQLGVTDLYDYLVAQNTTGIESFPSYNTIINGQLVIVSSISSVTACSADGQHLIGPGSIVDLPGSACSAPQVSQQPWEDSGVIATQANIRSYATGSAPMTYQWYRNGVALVNGAAPWGDGSTTIVGADAGQLRLLNSGGITCVDQGTYYCTFTNPCGSAASGSWWMQVPNCCYPNCDGSTTAPVLNVADFTCFLQKFAAQDGYANCDSSTTAPMLNVADFTCFLQKFAAGCP